MGTVQIPAVTRDEQVTVLQESVEEAFRPVEAALARLSGTFEQALPIWIEVGRAANAAAERIKVLNRTLRPAQRLKMEQELAQRFPMSAAEIARARRLATVTRKRSPGAYPLPPAADQWPKAVTWATEKESRPPSCLKEADQLLRDYNAAHIPAYAEWLGARERRKANRAAPKNEPPATVYRRRWRHEATRATALEALAEKALRALSAAGLEVRALAEELVDIRDESDRTLRGEPLLVRAGDMATVAEAEAALWAAQDMVDLATQADRLEAQRALGAAIDSASKRAFAEFDADARIPWASHVLGTTTETIGRHLRLHRVWPELQHALKDRGTVQDGTLITLEEALALVAQREKEPGEERRDIFNSFFERHREGSRKDEST